MSERIPASTAKRVVFRAFLASDHVTVATGKTIVITISKNGGAFGNPAAGATNATEIANGFYYFDLGTTDTNTLGPLAYRGAEGTIDDVGDAFAVTNDFLTISNAIAALNNLSAAQVNAEVVDALATDSYAEPTGVPPASATLAVKLGTLYMALRNRVDVTSSKMTFYDDSGAGEFEKDLTDDGTTYSESEVNAI